MAVVTAAVPKGGVQKEALTPRYRRSVTTKAPRKRTFIAHMEKYIIHTSLPKPADASSPGASSLSHNSARVPQGEGATKKGTVTTTRPVCPPTSAFVAASGFHAAAFEQEDDESLLFAFDGQQVPDAAVKSNDTVPSLELNVPSQFAYQVATAVEDFRSTAQLSGEAVDVSGVAAQLQALGYSVVIRSTMQNRTFKTGDVAMLRTLHNAFLFVRDPADDLEPVVVDISFASHFEVPSARPGYRRLVERLPAVFAGSTHQLVDLVKRLARLLAEEYLAQGVAVPPWRSSTALLSRWLPTASHDVQLPAKQHTSGSNSISGSGSPTFDGAISRVSSFSSWSSISSTVSSIAAAASKFTSSVPAVTVHGFDVSAVAPRVTPAGAPADTAPFGFDVHADLTVNAATPVFKALAPAAADGEEEEVSAGDAVALVQQGLAVTNGRPVFKAAIVDGSKVASSADVALADDSALPSLLPAPDTACVAPSMPRAITASDVLAAAGADIRVAIRVKAGLRVPAATATPTTRVVGFDVSPPALPSEQPAKQPTTQPAAAGDAALVGNTPEDGGDDSGSDDVRAPDVGRKRPGHVKLPTRFGAVSSAGGITATTGSLMGKARPQGLIARAQERQILASKPPLGSGNFYGRAYAVDAFDQTTVPGAADERVCNAPCAQQVKPPLRDVLKHVLGAMAAARVAGGKPAARVQEVCLEKQLRGGAVLPAIYKVRLDFTQLAPASPMLAASA